jgi:hypothetical protein
MSERPDRFDRRLRQAHKQRQYENTGKELKAYFEANPRRAAQALLLSLPAQLDVWRQYAVSRFGVGLEDREQRKAQRCAKVAEAVEYTLLAIKYYTHDNALSYMTHHFGEEPGSSHPMVKALRKVPDLELARLMRDHGTMLGHFIGEDEIICGERERPGPPARETSPGVYE